MIIAGNHTAWLTADPRFAALQSRLEKARGREVVSSTLDTVRGHLGPDTSDHMLLVASAPEDLESIRLLVGEIHLQRWPVRVLLLETEQLAAMEQSSSLRPYVAHRLTWPADAARLIRTLAHQGARKGAAEAGSSARPKSSMKRDSPESVQEVIGRRLGYQVPSLLPLIERIGIAARHDLTLLLTGETGTGKTYLARLMHDCSPRRQHPFVTVPCGAIPSELLESAFFGHLRGSFTGADRDRQGKFAAAGEGTILLDEIDTLGLAQQASLLRVIETGEYEPIGSNQTLQSQARIIAASNWDLEKAVSAGKFRQDLYYRLNIMSFHLPPLRERVRDIAPLARGMAARFNTKFRKDLFDLSAEALAILESCPWPGNIRQLENIMQQAVLCSTGPVLLPAHLPRIVLDSLPATRSHADVALFQTREDMERNLIQRALSNNGDNRLRAARALGISRVTLYKKMKKYGMIS